MLNVRAKLSTHFAVFLTIFLFAVPTAASASSILVWGGQESDQTEMQISEGGAYSPLLSVPAPAHIVGPEIGPDGEPIFRLRGVLYRVSEVDGSTLREQLTTVFKHVPLDPDNPDRRDVEFSWPAYGTYELDVVSIPAPQVSYENSYGKRLAHAFFGEVAHAQLEGSVIETIHFTIVRPEPVCTEQCFSNVLFLPGIESSRLYRPDYNGGTEKLWEPGSSNDVQDLFLNPDGSSARFDVYAKESDVLDELPVIGTNIYKSFISKMDELKSSGMINDWRPISYDWRLTLDDILVYGNQVDNRIYYSGDLRATSSPYIIQELRRLATSSKSGKVTIIAHSNGGLVAKRLTEVLGPEASELIDKMIFVAVPQAGTPDAIAAALHGEAIGRGFIASQSTVRTFATTSPMVYQLMPSGRYFAQVDDAVIEFDPSLPEWRERYGDTIHSRESLHAYLVDSFNRVDAQTGDTSRPVQLSEQLLSNAETLHADLDNWAPPPGVQLIQIAGWGVDSTVKGITYKKKGEGINPNPTFTIDGDGRVVVPSALWTSASNTTNYWVDLNDYNNSHLLRKGPLAINHASILEVNELLAFLADNVREEIQSLPTYKYLRSESPASTQTRLHFALHSPLTIDIYDLNGNHTGVSTTTGQVEENIPGTYFVSFGEQKYIFADAANEYHLILDGYDSGTFTFVITEMDGDNILASTTFANVPVTPETTVKLDVAADLTSIDQLSVDQDGDGDVDFIVKVDGTIELLERAPDSGAQAPAQETMTHGGENGPPIPTAPITPTVLGTTTSATGTEQVINKVTTESAISSSPTATSTPKKTTKAPVKTLSRTASSMALSPSLSEIGTNSQVALVSEFTKNNLWSRIYRWILHKLLSNNK
ncbi:hypothetical protein HY970_03445 [Candidatus Kaiserbacteria bacterium]|nr:hypothetical protein [Candidatus Kaiserbacteria bacterium]